MWNSGSSGFGLPGAGRTWIFSFARLAKAAMAAPPSQQKSVKGGIRSPNASFRLAASRLGRTASNVAPLRSRATTTGICSADRPRLAALPPRRRAGLARPPRRPLNDSRMKVSSASTTPERRLGLSKLRAARNRCRHRKAVLGWIWQRSAALARLSPFDQGSRLIEPAILLVQAGHRSAGERIESIAAFDAAIARQTSRFAPRAGSARAAARTSPPRMTLLCDLPENIARARFAKRRRSRFAAFLGPVRVPRRRPRYEDLNALLTGIVGFRERELAKHDTALRPIQRRERGQPSREIRRLHLHPQNSQRPE